MTSSKKCILLALVGTVLLTASFVNGEQQTGNGTVEKGLNGAVNDFKELAQNTRSVAQETTGSIYGLGSKIFDAVGRGAATVYSHLPFVGSRTHPQQHQQIPTTMESDKTNAVESSQEPTTAVDAPTEPSAEEVSNEESNYDEAGNDEAGNGESKYDAANYDEAGNEEVSNEESNYDAAKHNEAGNDEAGNEETSNEEEANEQKTAKATSRRTKA